MIRPVLVIMTVCFSLNLMANGEDGSDYTAVNAWEEQSTEEDSEGSFDPFMMFSNEEEETDDAEYSQFEPAYDDDGYGDESDMDEDDSEMHDEFDEFDEFDESGEQSEPDFYEE